jgi:hypothetical protein
MQSVTLRLRERWQSATLMDAGWLLLCALLFWGSKGAAKLIDGVPGHAGAFWIPPLILAHGRVRRPGAAALTALLGAACWSLPGGDGGALAPYVAAGLVLDALAGQGERLRRLPVALLAGGLCHLAKFLFHNVPALLLGLSPHFLTWGLLPVAGLHLLFGVIGGLGGWLLLGTNRWMNRSGRSPAPQT